MRIPQSYAKRYRSLDAWRGIASVLVLLWHRYYLRTTLTNGFWLGVQLFFVISGYCIAAAVDNSREQQLSLPQFMRRRVRRIIPPYLGSLGLAAVVKLVTPADFFNGSRSVSLLWFWVSNFTLTQWSYLTGNWLQTGNGLAVPWFNPALLLGVHWSLNYEEQFYLLCGLILVFHRKARTARLLFAITVAVACCNALCPGQITGLFVDYWLQFFCGVLVYLRLCKTSSRAAARAFDGLLVAAAIVLLLSAHRRGDFPPLPNQLQFYGQLSLCLCYGLLLIVLRPYDDAVGGWRPVRVLRFIGKFSYSIYLVHWPMLIVLEPFSQQVQVRLGAIAADACILTMVLFCAYAFYRVFEKPFLNTSLGQAPRAPLLVTLPVNTTAQL